MGLSSRQSLLATASAAMLVALLTTLLAAPSLARACWDEAGKRYGVSPALLFAIAGAESNYNPQAVNRTHFKQDRTYDIGLMQINSGSLPALAKFGIDEHRLYEPCTNIAVGAWILSQKFAQHGVSWQGVGAYNAACTKLHGQACQEARSAYAWRVYWHLPGLRLEARAVAQQGLVVTQGPHGTQGRPSRHANHDPVQYAPGLASRDAAAVPSRAWADSPFLMAVRVSP